MKKINLKPEQELNLKKEILFKVIESTNNSHNLSTIRDTDSYFNYLTTKSETE